MNRKPDECTLPTTEHPLRVTEFQDLFAAALRSLARPGPTHLRLLLDPGFEAATRDLVARENACCSFFGFTMSSTRDGSLQLSVQVPPAYAEVLDGLAELATATFDVSP